MDIYYIIYIYVPGTYLSSIFGLQPSKTRPLLIKTRVIWVLGIYDVFRTPKKQSAQNRIHPTISIFNLCLLLFNPGSQPPFKKWWFLLEDDKTPTKIMVVRKPTYKKWWLDFQGKCVSLFFTTTSYSHKFPTKQKILAPDRESLGFFSIVPIVPR